MTAADLGPTSARTTGRTWTIEQHGNRPLTVNKVADLHRQQWARLTKTTREEWGWLGRAAKVPKLARATVTVTPLHANGRSPQDVAACAPAAKAAIDGLIDVGLLPDDDPDHLALVIFTPPDICGADGLRLLIEELHP